MASQIVETIAQQVLAGIEPFSRKRFKFIAVDEQTLRVHLKLGERTINTDIRYDFGSDTYGVKRYESQDGMLTYKTTCDHSNGIYCDQLAEIAGGF
jgi:hypothetical protein